MARHLIDDVPVGWETLGTDLLDGAPAELATTLTRGRRWPSSTLDHLITLGGSPPARMTVTHEDAADQDLPWGYILRPNGIEVISLACEDAGPLVGWNTDPRTVFSDRPDRWTPRAPAPVIVPSRTTPTRTAASATMPKAETGAARRR
ncbi:hypothetical protein [Streptomyces sp. NPDC127033]|uniref:hypothetical protein n=1 Tax=Streptomyces sp. NPDC127033 TaxID=3347110 RepID=UPI00365D289A